MLGCCCFISGKLVSARQTEFSGEVKRIERQTFFKSSDRLVISAGLQMKLTEKVQRVRIRCIQPSDVFEGIDGSVGLSKSAINDAEVVPGARALRLTSSCIEENVARFS